MRIRTYNNLVTDPTVFSNVVNSFFENLAHEYSRSGGSTGATNGTSKTEQPSERESLLPIDLWVTGEAFQVNAYLPGVNPEDVEITFETDELMIRGKLPSAPEGAEFVKRELFHGAFVRRLSFNVPVNSDGIEAHFQNGLLTLTIPKAEAVKPKTIKVQIK